jgi:hypothetical protein
MLKLAIAAAVLATAAGARAATPAEENARDIRCLIAVSELSQSKDKAVETAGLIASQYYLGRIDGRTPNADLEALIIQEAPKLGNAERGPLLATCGKLIEDRGKALEAIGNKLAGTK